MAKVDKKEKKVKDAKPVKAAVKEVINKVKDGKKDKKENEVKKSPTKVNENGITTCFALLLLVFFSHRSV